MQDYQKFHETMIALGEIFDKEITSSILSIYWRILLPHPDEACKQAFESVISEARFFPRPADLLERLNGHREHRATLAWLQALETIKRVGNYASVQFADPVIHSVIQAMGGWPRFCDGEAKDEKWKQKEFERLYTVIAERPGKHPEYLHGDHELQNAALGHEQKPEIIRIGFEQEKIWLIKA